MKSFVKKKERMAVCFEAVRRGRFGPKDVNTHVGATALIFLTKRSLRGIIYGTVKGDVSLWSEA